MSVAFDAFSQVAAEQTTSPYSWTHTPVGTPRAVIVFVAQQNATSTVSGVTYGGVAMTEDVNSPVKHTGTEDVTVYAFFLGSSIPTGAQSVEVTVTDVGNPQWAFAITLTADDDTEIVDSDFVDSDSIANPSVTLSLSGRTSFAALGSQTGAGATGDATPLSGWNERAEHDFGAQLGLCYTYDTIASDDVTAGYTLNVAEEVAMIAMAVSEVAAASTHRAIPGSRVPNTVIYG